MTLSGPADRFVKIRLAGAEHGRLAWAEGLTISLPAAALEECGLARAVSPEGVLRLPVDLPPLAASHVDTVRLASAFTPRPPASSRLPVSYRSVPGGLRRLTAAILGRAQRRRVHRWANFPGWPLDLSADVLDDWAQPVERPPRPTPVLVTHDIDSVEGFRNLVELFLPVEERCGARSTNYVIPCAWRLDDGLLRATRERGHELGIHGYDHSNRTPFASRDERQRRLDAARPLAERYGMIGYRAPSLLRTPELLRDLAGRYRHDSSVPTSGGLFPVPNNGCATARPFLLERIMEIPISLPRDGSLRFLGYAPREILDLWTECADLIARSRGVVVLLTHCERSFTGNDAMLTVYRRFLEWIAADDRFAFAMPDDVLAAA